jgi:calcineurin-like phosphoesterase family protein
VIWFWSDTHFNHEGILRYCSRTRPYISVAWMNHGMVQDWNARVRSRDTVYFLGDFAFPPGVGGSPIETLFAALHGQKHLLTGNHDEKNKAVLRLPWASQAHIRVVRDQGRKAVLCHYPLESWPSAHHGALHFHGHSHGNLKRVVPHRFDVGVDVYPSGPISFDELAALADAQTFEPSDHHGADL